MTKSDDDEVDLSSVVLSGNNELCESGITSPIISEVAKQNSDSGLSRLSQKRTRPESGESKEEDEGFIIVRNKSKRINRSLSKSNNHSLETGMNEDLAIEEKYEVCMTSKEVLPKQIGLAKLLRSNDIQNILKIKYKNPYKVIIQFKKSEDAQKLYTCSKIKEFGYRCQSTQQVSLSYGVVKNIDIEVEEKEILESFECDYELVSVRRMKKLNVSGKWVDSEAIQLCFKGHVLPTYVYGYGCRFAIEPYVFPVTQCSGCWKFGHLIRNCPINKVICPKCGGCHNNCETSEYTCINCKGAHMALSRECPVFLKEKKIRYIMSRQNCTYKTALETYLKDKKKRQVDTNYESTIHNKNDTTSPLYNNPSPTYRDILVSDVIIHREPSKEREINSTDQITTKTSQSKRKKKKKRNTQKGYQTPYEYDQNCSSEEEISTEDQYREKKQTRNIRKIDILSVIQKIKDIVIANTNFEEKIIMILKLIVDEVKNYMIKAFDETGWTKYIIQLFNNG